MTRMIQRDYEAATRHLYADEEASEDHPTAQAIIQFVEFRKAIEKLRFTSHGYVKMTVHQDETHADEDVLFEMTRMKPPLRRLNDEIKGEALPAVGEERLEAVLWRLKEEPNAAGQFIIERTASYLTQGTRQIKGQKKPAGVYVHKMSQQLLSHAELMEDFTQTAEALIAPIQRARVRELMGIAEKNLPLTLATVVGREP